MQEHEKPVRRMLCAVCGAATRGRQWHNRDTGYGLCERCPAWLAGRGVSADEMRDRYGARGVHYCVPQETPEQEAERLADEGSFRCEVCEMVGTIGDPCWTCWDEASR